MNIIEDQFQGLLAAYTLRKKLNKESGVEAVLRFLYDRYQAGNVKIWWWSYEFIGQVNSVGDFLSHRAPARASDLAIDYPELVEDRRIGRLAVYRLRVENIDKIKEFLKETN